MLSLILILMFVVGRFTLCSVVVIFVVTGIVVDLMNSPHR